MCTYWPEFGERGKTHVTVRHVLSHKAGVPYPPEGFDTAMMIDWDRMCAGIADLPLSFEPGTLTAYHNYTYGYLVGEIVRRIDGRPLPQFLQEEVCGPQGVDSLFFGVPASELGRVATRAPDNDFNRPEVQQACIPSSGMITNARSLARHYATLPRLLSAAADRAGDRAADRRDGRDLSRARQTRVSAIAWATTPGRAPDRGRSAMSARRCSATTIPSVVLPSRS